jgi:hypothetical protein
MKNNIEIKINDKSIKSVKDLNSLELSVKEKKELSKELKKLFLAIENEDSETKSKNSDLIKENEFLKAQIQKLNHNRGIDKVLLGFHEKNYSSAAADLLINPNPIEIHGTEKGVGLSFMVSIMNILVIKSDGRIKDIYLSEPIVPKEGGKERDKISTNAKDLNFENLLLSIQKKGHHLIRVNKSTALNIYQYSLSEENCFTLNISEPAGFDKKLSSIRTDSYFDSDLYHKRLMEIDRINKHHVDFTVNIKKIEEIKRYKNSLHK